MNITDFKAGVFVQQYQYKSFEPNMVNIPWEISDMNLLMQLSRADNALGELNAFSQLIPNIDFFIKMHKTKEGTQSSKIEGTHTTMEEAVQKEEDIESEKRDDWKEVQNYIQAMNKAMERLKTLPLCNRLLMEFHQMLLEGVRGQHKDPGEFRRSQNWIGGASLNDATYIPPHCDNVPALMGDLELFLHNDTEPLPMLIKIAIAHYQIETIHPFLDGNGRIGRMLITLFLVSNKLLQYPTLYLSDFLERNRSLYYDNLMRARTHNDLVQWIKFFLEGVYQTAQSSIDCFKNIIILNQKTEEKIIRLGRKHDRAKALLHVLYNTPILDVASIAEELEVDESTAYRLTKDFLELEILQERTGYARNRMFMFDEYMALFR